MYPTLTRWEIFKSLFVKKPRLVYASIAKKTLDGIVSDIRDNSKKEVEKILYTNKEISTKYNVCSERLSQFRTEKLTVDGQLSDARKNIISLTKKLQKLERMLTTYKSDINKYIGKNKGLTKELDKKSSDYSAVQLKIKGLEDKLAKCVDSTANKKADNKAPKKKSLTKKDVLAIRKAKPSELEKLADKYDLTIDKLNDIKDKKLYKKW